MNEHSPLPSRAKSQSKPVDHRAPSSRPDDEAVKAREQSLRQELASVKKVNETIEGLLASLEKAKANMQVSQLGIIQLIVG